MYLHDDIKSPKLLPLTQHTTLPISFVRRCVVRAPAFVRRLRLVRRRQRAHLASAPPCPPGRSAAGGGRCPRGAPRDGADRKSKRLKSSHHVSTNAFFCLISTNL